MGESNGNPELLVLEKLNELRVKARELFTVNIDPTISYDLRGQSAGQANYRHNRIRLNRELLERYTTDFVGQTVPHEFAHLAAFQLYGIRIKPHGKEWKSVMLALGAEPTRTHNYEVTIIRRLKNFQYQCNCPGRIHKLSSIRHNRITKGRLYLCRKCGESLKQISNLTEIN